ARAQLPAPCLTPGRYILALHDLERRVHGGGAYRVSPEGGNRLALPRGGDVIARDGGAQGEAVGDSLRHHHDVRLDSPVLDAKPLATGAPEACLHFVNDEETTRLADDLGHALEVA